MPISRSITTNGFTPVNPEEQGVFYNGPEGSFEIENVGEFAAGPSLKETDDQNRQAKRSGFLSRQDKIKIAKRLVAEIEADLARLRKQAKTNKNSFIRKRIFAAEQQIAAWRIVAGGVEIPFFYKDVLGRGVPAVSDAGVNLIYFVTSGDGKQTAQASLPLPADVKFFPAADMETFAPPGYSIISSGNSSLESGIEVGDKEIDVYLAERENSSTSYRREWYFPIGGGECLMVVQQESWYNRVIVESRYRQKDEIAVDPSFPLSRNKYTIYTFSNFSFSYQEEIPLTRTIDYIAFRVGYEVAEAVPVPPGILTQLRKTELPLSGPTETDTTYFDTPGLFRGSVCDPAGGVDDPQDQIVGWIFERTECDSERYISDPYPTAKFSAYSNSGNRLSDPPPVVYYGSGYERPAGDTSNPNTGPTEANPSYWYVLEDLDKWYDLDDINVVEEVLQVSAFDYKTIGELNNEWIIGYPLPTDESVPSIPGTVEGKEQIYKWKKGPLLIDPVTGLPTVVGASTAKVTYETSPGVLRSDSWRKLTKTKGTEFQAGQHPILADYFNSFPQFDLKMDKVFINEWRKSGFCREVAESYGINFA